MMKVDFQTNTRLAKSDEQGTMPIAPSSLRFALRQHWPEYMMEAAELGLFMIVACVLAAVIDYVGSPVRQMLPRRTRRRVG